MFETYVNVNLSLTVIVPPNWVMGPARFPLNSTHLLRAHSGYSLERSYVSCLSMFFKIFMIA
jgi:hypothetical protein